MSLELAFSGASGRTALARRLYSWPFAVGRVFEDAGTAYVIVQSGSGGIITGDRLTQRMSAHDGARARVKGQGAMSVHREGRHSGSSEHVYLRADGRSVLENLAEPRILFEGSRLSQTCEVTIDEGVVITVDALTAHEPDAEYRSLLEVRSPAGLLARERQCVSSDLLPAGVGAFALVVGAGLVHDHTLWLDWHAGVSTAEAYGAASALPFDAGTAVRVTARDGQSLRRAVAGALSVLARQEASWTSSS